VKQPEPWVRLDYTTGGDTNPLVWRSASGDRFYLYNRAPGGQDNWLLESRDLKTWQPASIPSLEDVNVICATYHEWNGWYYWFSGDGYRMSRTPAEDPDTRFDNRHSFGEAWVVPQAAPFTGNRMLMVGFARPAKSFYATQTLFRELVQNTDGTLGMKFIPEMIPPDGDPVPLKLTPLYGKVSGETSYVKLEAAGNDAIACIAEGLPQDLHIKLRVVPEKGASGFGVCVRGSEGYANGRELCFEPGNKQFRYALAPDGTDASPIVRRQDQVIPAILKEVEGLGKPFGLEIIVRDDFIDVCIDKRHTLFHWRDDIPDGDRLFLFVRGGTVTFEDISVHKIKEQNKMLKRD
jgi:hypothetical protein